MNPQEKAQDIFVYWHNVLTEQQVMHPNINDLVKECCYTMIDINLSSGFPNIQWGDYWIEVKNQVKWM